MLFNITKQKSLAFIQIFVAVLILTAPSFLSLLSLKGAVYLTFTVSAFLMLLRIKVNKKIILSLKHTVYILLIAFGLISLLWISNISGHFVYLFGIAAVCVLTSLLKEYFIENTGDSFKRRIAYLISISGVTYSLYNIIYWISVVVPVAGNNGFTRGLISGDFSGIFLVISIVCTASLYKGNSKFRKFLISFSLILMAFCLLMTKSCMAWMFAVAFSLLLIIKNVFSKKSSKYTAFSSVVIVLYCIGTLIVALAGEKGNVFSDVFTFALKHPFGAGGGFLSARDTFTYYPQIEQTGTGLFLYLFSASGVFGALSCLVLIIRSVRAFVKLKNTESTIGILCLIALLLVPFGQSFATVMLVMGLSTYNEFCADLNLKLQMKQEHIKRLVNIVFLILTITASLTVLSFMEMSADGDFENGRYTTAYETYKTISAIDVFDSRCSKMAALCVLNDKTLRTSISEDALKLIDKAIKYDRNNLANYEKKAEIYFAYGKYNEAAAQYREILKKSAVNDKYNLSITKVLYEIIVSNPKGSSETKRAYEEIVNIAQLTENLDIKKEINDLADKALVYTKGELSDEREVVVE